MIVPVILSGGSGTRLWPLSRKLHPKQFINLVNETSLFQDTIIRLPNGFSDPLIVCNEEHRFLAAEQLREIDKETSGIILEPEGRNTAPAIALSALKLVANNQDPIMLILPADHLIKNIKIVPVVEAKSVLKYTLTKPVNPLNITESQILETQKTTQTENNLKQNLTH